jgi:hypothetical protein
MLEHGTWIILKMPLTKGVLAGGMMKQTRFRQAKHSIGLEISQHYVYPKPYMKSKALILQIVFGKQPEHIIQELKGMVQPYGQERLIHGKTSNEVTVNILD